jgi:hypothetical protein
MNLHCSAMLQDGGVHLASSELMDTYVIAKPLGGITSEEDPHMYVSVMHRNF